MTMSFSLAIAMEVYHNLKKLYHNIADTLHKENRHIRYGMHRTTAMKGEQTTDHRFGKWTITNRYILD